MGFFRSDYTAVARIFAQRKDFGGRAIDMRAELLEDIAKYFASQDPRFKRDTFMQLANETLVPPRKTEIYDLQPGGILKRIERSAD